MKLGKLLVVVVLGLVLLSAYLFSRVRTQTQTLPWEATPNPTETRDCIPTFADGGGPYYKPNSPFREKISDPTSSGQELIVEGKVLLNDCQTTVPDAVIDIWQADETGVYPDEWFRGQIRTNENGEYRFETVVPKGYGSGTGFRPPHIHFKIFIEGREIITSQMFFPESRGRAGFSDAYIMDIQEEGENLGAKHDIILPI